MFGVVMEAAAMARVLIVEDSAAVRMALAEVVAALGHTVEQAPDGRAAIETLQTERFDLVITDVLMPEADGVEVIKALRALDRGTRVLAVSGGAPNLPASYALRMTEMFNADAVLYKPFLNEELEATVIRLLADSAGEAPAPAR